MPIGLRCDAKAQVRGTYVRDARAAMPIGLRCDELGALDVLATTEPAERRAVCGRRAG
jgi:hypothetical protein